MQTSPGEAYQTQQRGDCQQVEHDVRPRFQRDVESAEQAPVGPQEPLPLAGQLPQSRLRMACAGDFHEHVESERVTIQRPIPDQPPPGNHQDWDDDGNAASDEALPTSFVPAGCDQGQPGETDQSDRVRLGQHGESAHYAQDNAPPHGQAVLVQTKGQPQCQRAERHDQVVVIDRSADEEEHGVKSHQCCRQHARTVRLRRDRSRDVIGQSDGDGSQQNRQPAHDVDCQRRAVVRKGLSVRVYRHVDVTVVGQHSDVCVGVQATHLVQVARVDPPGQERTQRVVQRRLAAFLPPQLRLRRVLYRQTLPLRQVLHDRVVPQLIGCFEDGCDDAVDDAQNDERAHDHRDRYPFPRLLT